jgi:hypothetical protein
MSPFRATKGQFLLFAFLVPFDVLEGHSSVNFLYFPEVCRLNAPRHTLRALKRQNFLSDQTKPLR